MKPTIQEIQEILRIFLDSGLQDLRLEIGDVRLAVSKAGAAPAFSGLSAPAAAVEPGAVAAVPGPAASAPAASATAAVAPAGHASAEPQRIEVPAAARNGWIAVKAPSLGVFYRRPAPDQPPFVQVDDRVEQDDPVCLIEVMKMYTRVAAPCKGRVAEILVEDGQMAEFGQTLMFIEPA